MALEDSFIIVQNEVINALHNLRTNFTEWTEGEKKELSREDANACLNDLKNGIKSIQWDLDELEESLENSNQQSKLAANVLQSRKKFIEETRDEIKQMSEHLSRNNSILKKPDLAINFGSQQLQNGTKYHRLINAPEVPSSNEIVKATFDPDEEHKSPYNTTAEPDITVSMLTFDRTYKKLTIFDRLRDLLTGDKRFRIAAGFITIALILIIIMLI